MCYAPIVVFTYNREHHLKETLRALNRCELQDKTDLYFFSDGPKNTIDVECVENVRKVIDEFEKDSLFRSITVYKSELNRGLSASIIDGVTKIINRYSRIIVLEDDLIVSCKFLVYMNEALDYYQKCTKIWSISGYSFSLPAFNDYNHDIFLSWRGCSWGWSTWKDRWNTVDWNIKDYRRFVFSPLRRIRFNRGGTDLSSMLDRQMQGLINSWAVRWCYAQSKQNKLTVYPVLSQLVNAGLDGSGTHSQSSDRDIYSTSTAINSDFEINFDLPPVDRTITKQFRQKYGDSLLVRIKDMLKMLGAQVHIVYDILIGK